MRLLRTLVLVVLFIPTVAWAYTNPGSPRGYVSDFANILTEQQRQQLEQKLTSFAQTSSNQVAVVLIPSLDGDTVENFAVKLFADWQIGQTKLDNGVLLLVAIQEHQMRIEVGYGLEGALTDAQSGRIIRDILTPAFRANDFYGGIDRGTDAIIAATRGEYQAISSSDQSLPSEGLLQALGFVFFLAIQFIASVLARSKSWWAGGVVGAICAGIAGLLLSSWLLGGAIAILAIPLGLYFDFAASRAYQRGHRINLFWLGGFGGGSGGRGGFGGFGGGRSGGGGASGGW